MQKDEEIKHFYNLKKKYEKQNKIVKSKILHNKHLDIKSKKTQWKSYKKLCVNCKKPVGTYFSVKNKRLIARCGALNSSLKTVPCDLNMDITLDNYKVSSEILEENKSIQNKLENDINLKKLDIVYNYDDEESILKEFDKTKKKYLKNNKSRLAIIEQLDKHFQQKESEKKLSEKIDSYLSETKKLREDKEYIDLDTISAYLLDVKNMNKTFNKMKYKNFYMKDNTLVKEEHTIYNTLLPI